MNNSNADIPIWVNWAAQDISRIWWGYSVEPLRFHKGWYENEVGDSPRYGYVGLSWLTGIFH